MILKEDSLGQFLDKDGVYHCDFIRRSLSSSFNQVLFPLGKLVSFIAPLRINALQIPKCLIFAGEIRNTNMFGAVSFSRFLATQIGSLLTSLTDKDYFVEEGCILCENKQISVNIFNKVKEACLFHIVFPLEADENFAIKTLNLDETKHEEFQTTVCASFDTLMQQVFKDSCNDNI